MDKPTTLSGILANDRKVRIVAARHDINIFTSVYLSEYIGYEMAPMHKEMLALAQDQSVKLVDIMAFRGSGKSTIMSFIYPIWAVIGVQQKKCIVLISQTQTQARQQFANIKRELEINELLRDELGPFESFEDEWGNSAIILSRYNAKIIAASVDQSIRGLRHDKYRPDLIILDDVEDMQSVRTAEGREKLWRWFTGDIVPLGDRDTKIVVVGSKLHEDSLSMRLAHGIEAVKRSGKLRVYPIVGDDDQPLWPGKYPDKASIETQKREIDDEVAYQREYMLKIIPDDYQVIHADWIHYDDEYSVPLSFEHIYTAMGVDLAIKQSDAADYTAMVSADVYGRESAMRIVIQPNPINEKLLFPQTVQRIKDLYFSSPHPYRFKIFVEEVAFQAAVPQQLASEGIEVFGVGVQGRDKRSRLALVSNLIKSGTIIFPAVGAEALIHQLVGFGSEKHDDLVDAFTLLILEILKQDNFVVTGDWFFIG